jgi:RNA polymerase sigma factor (sigma-70 family)
MRPMNWQEFAAFYEAEYEKLVRILTLYCGSVDDAEDAAQNAMFALFRCSQDGKAIAHKLAWVCTVGRQFLAKQGQRDKERMLRELRGGHLTPEGCVDDQLTAWEDEEYVEQKLGLLTSARRDVIKLVIEGLRTSEIAETLGKKPDTIRQLKMQGRNLLKQDPDIAAAGASQPSSAGGALTSTAATPKARKEEVQ